MNPFDAVLTRIEGADTDAIRGRPSPRRGNRGRPIPQGLSPQGPISQSPEILAIQGTILTPYVLKVEIGEDIVSKIKAFTKEGSWKDETVVILSATGSISSVYIGSNGNSVIRIVPEGQYDILSLNGSFTVSKSRVCGTEGLMVTLAGTDNSVFGGTVLGMLIAATPIQVVAGSFTNAKGDGGRGRGTGTGIGKGKGRRRGRGRGSSSNTPSDSGGSSSDPPPSDLRAPSKGGSGSRGGGSLSNPLSSDSGDLDPSQYIIYPFSPNPPSNIGVTSAGCGGGSSSKPPSNFGATFARGSGGSSSKQPCNEAPFFRWL